MEKPKQTTETHWHVACRCGFISMNIFNFSSLFLHAGSQDEVILSYEPVMRHESKFDVFFCFFGGAGGQRGGIVLIMF